MKVVYNDRLDFAARYHKGFCHARIYVEPGMTPVAIVTELGENRGWSVTNGAEAINTEIQRWGDEHFPAAFREGFIHIEHYPWRFESEMKAENILTLNIATSYAQTYERCTWSLVDLLMEKGRSQRMPSWRALGLAEIERLIGGPLEEQSDHGALPLVEVGRRALPWQREWRRDLIAPEPPNPKSAE